MAKAGRDPSTHLLENGDKHSKRSAESEVSYTNEGRISTKDVSGAGFELLTELDMSGLEPTPRVLAPSTITTGLWPRGYRFSDIVVSSAELWS